MQIPKSIDEIEEGAFRPKTGRGKQEGQRQKDRKLLNEVKRLCGHKGRTSAGNSSKFGKGRRGLTSSSNMQRVVVQSRIVKLKGDGKKLIKKHIDYITRSGVEKDGMPATPYNENTNMLKEDLNKFVDKCQHDRHTFRMIISPEHGEYLDLKEYTRELIYRMEKDMNTKLQWVAVNHYNTDNPHTHLFIRGVNDKGNDLVINKDYISNGIRIRGQEISTSYLGHRTELDFEEEIQKDIRKDRFTALDKKIIKFSIDNVVDISTTPPGSIERFQRNAIQQRLAYLNKLGLATETKPGKWQVHSEAEKTLKSLGLRGDIIKTMHARMRHENTMPDCLIYSKSNNPQPIKGVILDKGLADELSGDTYVIVKATNNKAYYIPLSNKSEKEGHDSKIGSVVTVSQNGDYTNVHTHSRISIAEQIHADGPTYLDRLIVKNGLESKSDKLSSTVDIDITAAKVQRFQVLKEKGLTNTPEAGKPLLKYDAFDKLEQAEHDKIYRVFKDKEYTKAELKLGKEFTGHVVKITNLSDGSYAVIANTAKKELAIVPYQRGMEKAMNDNKELTIEMHQKRIGFQPAKITIKSIERTQEKGKSKGIER